jgi:hypothetical protein
MKTDLSGRIALLLLVFLVLEHLWTDFKPTAAYAAGGVKVVTVTQFSGGAILGFSCAANNRAGDCYILTRE